MQGAPFVFGQALATVVTALIAKITSAVRALESGPWSLAVSLSLQIRMKPRDIPRRGRGRHDGRTRSNRKHKENAFHMEFG